MEEGAWEDLLERQENHERTAKLFKKEGVMSGLTTEELHEIVAKMNPLRSTN